MSYRLGIKPMELELGQRTAGFHYSIVYLSESVPNIGLMTYETSAPTDASGLVMLAKLMFGFGSNEVSWLRQDNLTDVTCENIDGGLRGTGKCSGVSYEVEAYPLVSVNRPATWHGGLVLRFRVDDGKAFVRLSGGDIICTHDALHNWVPHVAHGAYRCRGMGRKCRPFPQLPA